MAQTCRRMRWRNSEVVELALEHRWGILVSGAGNSLAENGSIAALFLWCRFSTCKELIIKGSIQTCNHLSPGDASFPRLLCHSPLPRAVVVSDRAGGKVMSVPPCHRVPGTRPVPPVPTPSVCQRSTLEPNRCRGGQAPNRC